MFRECRTIGLGRLTQSFRVAFLFAKALQGIAKINLGFRPIGGGALEGPFLEGGKIDIDRLPQRPGILVAFAKQQKRAAKMVLRRGPFERQFLASDEPKRAMVDFDRAEHILAGAKCTAVRA